MKQSLLNIIAATSLLILPAAANANETNDMIRKLNEFFNQADQMLNLPPGWQNSPTRANTPVNGCNSYGCYTQHGSSSPKIYSDPPLPGAGPGESMGR